MTPALLDDPPLSTWIPGETFIARTIAAESHPLSRGEAVAWFVDLSYQVIARARKQGAHLAFRGTVELEELLLPDGSPGWVGAFRYEVLGVDEDSTLGTPNDPRVMQAGIPVALAWGLLVAVFAAAAAYVTSNVPSLTELETTYERIVDKTMERAAPQLSAALVIGLGIVLVFLLRAKGSNA